MCLAVPGRIVRLYVHDDTAMADVDFGGTLKEVCLQFVENAQVGEYVIVHVGFAIQRLDEESALATLGEFQRMGILEDEFGDAPGTPQQEGLPAEARSGAVRTVAAQEVLQ